MDAVENVYVVSKNDSFIHEIDLWNYKYIVPRFKKKNLTGTNPKAYLHIYAFLFYGITETT